jgi:uncharacterized membrane protein YesL
MILFHIKKTFFDGWDNLLALILANLVLGTLWVVELALGWTLIANSGGAPVSLLEIFVLMAGYVLCSVMTGAGAWVLNRMADSKRPGFRDFWDGIKKTAARSAIYGAASYLAILAFLVSMRFYLGRGDLLGTFLAGILGWAFAFCVLALQYFYPVMVRLGGSVPKIVKKCMMISVDNIGFTLYLFAWSVLGLALSVFTMGFVPGAGGLVLSGCEAIRLRTYKYDWLEANPGAKRNAVPWDELLADDEESLGPRSLRGMIFPWKDDKR